MSVSPREKAPPRRYLVPGSQQMGPHFRKEVGPF